MMGGAKKSYHHGNLHQKLVEAGELAVAELPLAAVTLREISRRAGVSHAAPKHHFSTLADLMGEIAARGLERLQHDLDHAVQRSAQGNLPSRLNSVGRAYLHFAQTNPELYALMFGQGGNCAVTPRLAEQALALWANLEETLAADIGAQRARNGALMIVSSLHGLALLIIEQRLPPHLEPHAAMESVLRMALSGIQAELA